MNQSTMDQFMNQAGNGQHANWGGGILKSTYHIHH